MAGFGLDDFDPPVAEPTSLVLGDPLDGCYTTEGALGNVNGWNLSAETENGGDLLAWSDDNNSEDARAHRGVMSGDFIMLGYSYTPDWAVARYTDLENYEFWVRTSTNGGTTWTNPKDLTSTTSAMLAAERGLADYGVNVKEPRIVKTPGHGPECPTGIPADPTTTNPEHCRAPSTVLLAWGSETNVYEHLGGSEELDIFVTRTTNKGASYEPVQRLAGEPAMGEGESQLQITPDGKRVWATWFQEDAGTSDAMLVGLYEALKLEVSAPDPGSAGVLNAWNVTDGTPGANVTIAVSANLGSTNVPGCPGVTLGIAGPNAVTGGVLDANGEGVFTRTIPAGVAGRDVYFQAVETSTCRVSGLVPVTL